MIEETSILLKLLIAHFLTDFVLQPTHWITDRKTKKWRSGKLYYHALVTAAVAYVLTGLWNLWWLPIYVFTTHFLIDLWKSYRPAKISYFLIDQLLHLITIVVLWLIIVDRWGATGVLLSRLYSDPKVLVVSAAYIFITWPMGIMVGLATERWREEAGANAEGLARAGMWIGFFERFLILTFILIDQYTAVGLLIAAKSILRFNDKEGNTQKKTEYVLIGTLMSFAISVLLGWIISTVLQAT
ncbi:DUF3307 domain-containing protein [Flavihumibacter sp. R14]|nr:DUF3307 domain-containing protein [Flavihumibacter soli]